MAGQVSGETFGEDLHLAKLTPEFSLFQAILGWRIKSTDQWAPFARLRDIYGWKKLTKACEQCEPGSRWASDMEKLCRTYAKDDAEAEAMATKEPPKPRPDPKQAAIHFAQIRQRVLGDKT